MKHGSFCTVLAVLGCLSASAAAQGLDSGPCTPTWQPTFGELPGTQDTVLSLATFDDGSGDALYVGGQFLGVGSQDIRYLARWDGASWSEVGGGLSGIVGGRQVAAMKVFDDGGGAALYVGGVFTFAGGVLVSHIARWNGASWSALGFGLSAGTVDCLEVFDDGGGPALFAGGNFVYAAPHPVRVAKWDGTIWVSLGSGANALVSALQTFDDGGGAALYAGGSFTIVGGVPASCVARWDGASWSPLGAGTNGPVRALAVFDDGGGAALYAGGEFTAAGGAPASRLARWDGTSWSPVGAGTNGNVRFLEALDDGGGAALHVGGSFSSAGGTAADNVARWDGTSWSALDGGTDGSVRALAVFDDGGGPVVHAGGSFTFAGDVAASHIAKWDGSSWSAFDSGLNERVAALTVFDDGGGEALYAGGSFTSAGGIATNRIARWDGELWTPLGSGMDDVVFSAERVAALSVFDDGGGSALYAGGSFPSAGGVIVNDIARWDGTSWSGLAGGIGSGFWVSALTVFDDGSGTALYAGGNFTLIGGVPAQSVARWDGAGWTPLGGGVDDRVEALAVFDDGGGAALYAGGSFASAGGAAASNVARWDGTSWSALGSGIGSPVYALAVFDDGGGAALYAGGHFTTAGGAAANNVARWDGTSWAPLGAGVGDLNHNVSALAVFDDGSGPALYAAGAFPTAGGAPASCLARWDGTSWTPLGGGTSARATALTVFDDGGGAALHAGGEFRNAFDSGDSYLAKWGCETFPSFCDASDGSLAACPCAPGAPDSGCDLPQATGGVRLDVLARTRTPNGVTMQGTGFNPGGQPTAIVIRSTSLDPASPVVFGDGLRCVNSSPLVRLGAAPAIQGVSTHTFGHGASAGTFYYQLWFRSHPATYCDPAAVFNLSNGRAVTW